MGNLNLSEIILLVVLAVVIFGPDKLPELARKAARLVRFLRGVANNAQDTVRRELGPEYADLQLSDLQPKNLVRRVLAEDYQRIEGEIRGVGDDLRQTAARLDTDVAAVRADVAQAREAIDAERAGSAKKVAETSVVVAGLAPYDIDAT